MGDAWEDDTLLDAFEADLDGDGVEWLAAELDLEAAGDDLTVDLAGEDLTVDPEGDDAGVDFGVWLAGVELRTEVLKVEARLDRGLGVGLPRSTVDESMTTASLASETTSVPIV